MSNDKIVRVAPCDEFFEGEQREVEVAGTSVLVVLHEGKYYALRNNCTHRDYPLLGGELSMGRITCEKHGAKFEVATGKAKTLPAVKAVQVYKTEIRDEADGPTLYVHAL